jgi:hypothetical protein
MKFLCMAAIIVCLSVELHSQSNVLTHNIGDKLPTAIVDLYTGGGARRTSLDKLRGNRCLLIDFFATWCAPCIGSLAELNKLSVAFTDELRIVPVTYEAMEKWKSFARTNKIAAGNQLPVIVNDKQLQNWFPHRMVPHEVWVDRQGIVRYITSQEELTARNIKLFVSGQPLALGQKKDKINFDYRLPLQTNDTGFFYRSVLTAVNPGLPALFYENRDNILSKEVSRVLITNTPLVDMYYHAYRNGGVNFLNFKNIELDLADPAAYVWPYVRGDTDAKTNAAWGREHMYCYERCLQAKIMDSVFYADMVADLNAVGPLKAAIQKKEKPVWLLVSTKRSNEWPGTSGGASKLIWQGNTLAAMQNSTLNSLVRYLNSFMDNWLVIDESGIDGPVDMELNIPSGDGNSHLDIPAVQNALHNYGLDLVLSWRVIDVLYITDKK